MKFLAYNHRSPLVHFAGGERYLQTFLEKLSKKGNECLCLFSDNVEPIKKHNDVFYISEKHENVYLEEFVTIWKPDFIIAQFHTSERVIRTAHRHNIRVIYIAHTAEEFCTKKEIQLLNSKDICIFNTFWIYRKLSNFTKAKSFVLHPQINVRDIDVSREYITFVNLVDIKGVDIFYKIARAMKDRKFLAVKGGYGNQIIEELPNVKFVENQKDLFDYVYKHTNIFLAPSLRETYGMCAAEAAYNGIPCILSNTAGFEECLGKTSIIIKTTNHLDYINAIKKLDNDSIYKNYSLRTKEFIRKDILENNKRFEEIYKYLLNKINIV